MRVLLVDCNPFAPAVTPISLGYLAAALRAAGHAPHVLALGADTAFSPRALGARLGEWRPGLVGFAAYQRNMLEVRALARLAKEAAPGCRVVLGGPQGMFLPDAALAALPEVDFLSRGEGELAVCALADALGAGRFGPAEEAVPGVTSRRPDGSCVTGPSPALPEDLDVHPSPWLDGVLDPARWAESVLLTSRGCPHHCVFCLTPATCQGRMRSHSLERVLEEIAWVARRGSGRLWFADPNFGASKPRLVRLLEGIASRDLGVKMWIEVRAELLDPSLVRLMGRAGVKRVAVGLESASPAVLEGLGKGSDPARVRAAARLALDAGIDVELFSQYALPGERMSDALTTLEFVRACGVAIRGNSNAQQLQLYFGSEVTRRHRELGLRPLRERLPPYLSIGTEFETEWMSRADIARVRGAWRDASADGARRVVS